MFSLYDRKYLVYLHHMLNWNSSHGDNARLTSGRPILHAEGQFMLSHYSPSQFVPMKTIGARNLKEVLRKAIAESNGNQSLEVGMIGSFQHFFLPF